MRFRRERLLGYRVPPILYNNYIDELTRWKSKSNSLDNRAEYLEE